MAGSFVTSTTLLVVLLCYYATDLASSHSVQEPMSTGERGGKGTSKKWTLDEEFSGFDEAKIRIRPNLKSSKTGYGAKQVDLNIDITAFNRTFRLALKRNKFLVHPSFKQRAIDQSGKVEFIGGASKVNDDCYYSGYLEDDENALVGLSTCQGIRAQISDHVDLYNVEPLGKTLSDGHRMYKQSQSQQPRQTCGNSNIREQTRFIQKDDNKRQKRDAAPNLPDGLPVGAKIVEMFIVNADSQYQAQGQNLQQVESRALEIVNFVSTLYQRYNVFVTLIGMETWIDGDRIALSNSDSGFTLSNFCDYRRDVINVFQENDNAHLITAVEYDGGVVGLGYVGTMCSGSSSCSIVSDNCTVPGCAAEIMAHELGHNFGMSHDDASCTCADPSGGCLMSAYTNNPPATMWSQCSTDLMDSIQPGYMSCLNDFNNVVFDSTSVCGNGIVETGEECDCGNTPDTVCNSSCCDSSTCTLRIPAKCASGPCCDVNSCEFKPVATVCRSARGVCDLAEYCSGTEYECPSDVLKHNGVACSVGGETAYCYDGSCQSQTSQCHYWWGSSVGNSADICYTYYNVKGYAPGNCGGDGTLYNKCATSDDSRCGLLHCDIADATIPQAQLPWTSISVYGNALILGTTTYPCTCGYAELETSGLQDPAYVPNGAACADNKMCLDKQCVTVSSVLGDVCPDCNQHGVCNSIGQCHCDVGYNPPDCSLTGYGGSNHSNAASTSTDIPTATAQTTTTVAPTTVDSTATAVAGAAKKQPAKTTQVATKTSTKVTTTASKVFNGAEEDPDDVEIPNDLSAAIHSHVGDAMLTFGLALLTLMFACRNQRICTSA